MSTTLSIRADRLPTFFILGATKSGTTSLHHYLRQHPGVFLPATKELHYFNGDAFDATHRPDPDRLNDYQQYYEKGRGVSMRGDATPAYFHQYERVIPRLTHLYSEVDCTPRFILLFRDPVERAWSHYLHARRAGIEKQSFEEALAYERTLDNPTETWHGYIAESQYARQLQPWLNRFDRDRFLFLLTDDLKPDPTRALRCIYEFLEVNPDVRTEKAPRLNQAGEVRSPWLSKLIGNPPAWLHTLATTLFPLNLRRSIRERIFEKNVKAYDQKPTLPAPLQAHLREVLSDDVRRLEPLIDRNLGHWLPS